LTGNCLRDLASVARYGVILPGHLRMADVDTVSQGVIYSHPPSSGRCWVNWSQVTERLRSLHSPGR